MQPVNGLSSQTKHMRSTMSSKEEKIIDAMRERNIAVHPYEIDEGAVFISISEYEAVTGERFPYSQEEYERHCC
jgi:hypothetical protein